jgi:molecular chaperone GrpE
VETADVPENTVVQVFQDGYLYHEKVLRHAKVGVSKRPSGAAPAEQQAEPETGQADDGEAEE